MKDTPYLEISMVIDSFDYVLIKGIIENNNFPHSKFTVSSNRFIFECYRDEVPFLLHKLRQQGQEEYMLLAEHIELIFNEKFTPSLN